MKVPRPTRRAKAKGPPLIQPLSLPGKAALVTAPAVESPVHPQSLAPGRALEKFEERYDLKNVLGQGGMGVVHQAQDHLLHRAVAVKVMHDEVAAKEVMARRFYKEAQVSAQLEHPGIVPTYDIELGAKGHHRLAMRFIRGQTLLQKIEEDREKLAPGAGRLHGLLDRLELFVRACDAVHFAHERGVVHRDLKPENIMVGPHRDAYVMDWGLASLQSDRGKENEEASRENAEGQGDTIEVDDDPKATTFGELMGTIAYMAPEQAMGVHEEVGPGADQFALAMTLHELVVLDNARGLESVNAALTHAVLGESLPLPEWVPKGLSLIILKASAVQVEERYESVKEFAEDVRRFMRDEELVVAPDPWAKRLWRRLSEHKVLVLSGALALVLAFAAQALFLVLQDLDRAEAKAVHAQEVAAQVGQATAAAQSINARARGVERELAALASVVKHVLTVAEAPPVRPLRPADLEGERAPRDTKRRERYRQLITLERAVMVRAPSASAEAAQNDEARLALVESEFKRAYEAGGFVRGVRGQKTAAPLQWTYVGTKNGVLLNYPGAAGLQGDYDPRTRPWYEGAKGSHGPRWGDLYGDASGSGTLVASNQAVYDSEGGLLAVVGIDFRLRDLQEALSKPNIEGFQEAWLLSEEGLVVAASQQEKGYDDSDSGTRELPSFARPEVLSAIENQPASGQVLLGGRRYLYAAIVAVGWTYVVAVSV